MRPKKIKKFVLNQLKGEKLPKPNFKYFLGGYGGYDEGDIACQYFAMPSCYKEVFVFDPTTWTVVDKYCAWTGKIMDTCFIL